MKRTILTMLVGLILLPLAASGIETMSERAQALMSALDVKEAADEAIPKPLVGPLSQDNFKKVGTLNLQIRTLCEDPESVSEFKLAFSDDQGSAKAWGRVLYAPSAENARVRLFEYLAMNSLPMELLLQRYEIKEDGPGDLCVVERIFDQAKNEFVVDALHVHFLRGNIVVSLHANDKNVSAEDLARVMDQKIVDEQ